MNIIQNETLRKLIKSEYTIQDIQKIRAFLIEKETLSFPSLDNGLFPAAIAADAKNTGYKYVWVRDNIYIDYAHWLTGQPEVTSKNLLALMSYFKKFKFRFEGMINQEVAPNRVMDRPNVRFDGCTLTEIDEEWEHAQNDALGYFLWLFCKFYKETDGAIGLQQDSIEILALFPLYFQAIRYWEDEDSGHWEEVHKIAASSIGVVVAGLKALRDLYMEPSFEAHYFQYKDQIINLDLLDDLIEKGISALNKILPSECIQPQPKERRYDGALLFLIYPLDVVADDMAERILSDAITHLQGNYGIRRYLGDSFWCRDFQDLPQKIQTSIHIERQKWLEENGKQVKTGEEAQWCIFDPIVSAIFGRRFQSPKRKAGDLEQQIKYLNRSLGQITGKGCKVKKGQVFDHEYGAEEFIEIEELKCPELYFIQEDNYIPNVSTPLLWTQANLSIALKMMEQSLISLS